MKRTNIARAHIFALATTVAACAQDDPASPVMSAAPRGAVSMSDSVQDLHGLELEWYNAGSVVPGFAGMYFDSSQTLVVTGNSQSHANAAISRANQILASTGRRLTTARFRQVKYDFRSLATWRQAIRDIVMSIDGIQSMDVDEAANVIAVGVANADAEARALVVAANAGIPKDAFATFRQAAISPMTELGDNIRPLTGGTRYGFHRLDVYPNYSWVTINWCTVGIPIIRSGTNSLLLVSHYTVKEGAVDYDPNNNYGYAITQPWCYMTGTGGFGPYQDGCGPFGGETFDRLGVTCAVNRKCRHAETAVWHTNDIYGGQPIALGHIARTLFVLPGVNPAGFTRTIDPAKPYFTIVQDLQGPLGGEVVQKVGYATGWTNGWVITPAST